MMVRAAGKRGYVHVREHVIQQRRFGEHRLGRQQRVDRPVVRLVFEHATEGSRDAAKMHEQRAACCGFVRHDRPPASRSESFRVLPCDL
ncbi:hypothetical protein [Burkholderia puraquae]|uniref:hypothetical protein n=1 Tax=Burkholderia puraquae TaxID=1904757 RepID=UPI0013FDCF82|nr:hypothetical protein [Burkholderia puraquae]